MLVTLPTVDPSVINVMTAIAAAGGAILIKVIEKWLSRRNESNNEAERIRKELREEVIRYHLEVIRLEKELDEWKTKYWEKKQLYESDELRIDELEAEVSGGAAEIKHLSGSIQNLLETVKQLRENDE